jgi:DNA processing protein
MTDLAYLALALVPGIGRGRMDQLLRAFTSPAAVLEAPYRGLLQVPGITRACATAIRNADRALAERAVAHAAAIGAQVLTPGDPGFPPALREIPDAPTLLFAAGRLELLETPCVAIVGSRSHTRYGGEVCRHFASGLARCGLTVVSGMARGLDALAHTAALDAGGGSIGVLGNGFGVIYPAANRALYERMVQEGCLVTELPPGERPHAGTFPRRNRLISGLCRVTVLIEAAPESGAIITADCALEQGRTVLAVPGPITSRTSHGCNRLIQQGAKPATSVEDVLEELGLSVHRQPAKPAPPDVQDLTGVHRTLWDALAERRHVDALVAVAGADPAAVLTALTEMEMRGLVRQEAGMVFERV